MADSILKKEVKLDQLTEISQAQGFSKQGELFSGKGLTCIGLLKIVLHIKRYRK